MNTEKLFSILLIVLLLISIDAESASSADERWHVLSIDGTAVGSVHETHARRDDERVTTESVIMVINRLDTRIETSTYQESIESADGELLGVRLEIKTSDQTMTTEAHRDGNVWVTRSQTPGVPDRHRPLSAPLKGPGAVAELLAGLMSPGDSVRYDSFVAMTMQPGEVRAELVGFETVGEDSLRVIEEHLPGLPAPLTRVIDSKGRNVITRMPSPFGITQTVVADELAASLARSGGELPDEMFEATILKTGVRLPTPRRMEYLELALQHRNPGLGWPDLNSHNQRVLAENADQLVLAIERHHPSQSVPLVVDADEPLAAYLESNALLHTAQPELVKLARSLTEGETDRWQAALNLQRWVADNLSFDAGVVLASSSEVLANRRGTCTEFAVLLTALARAAGIPSRFVTGYVYAHGMLAGHAWTEVRIGTDWLALDAAIPADGPADAARFAFDWTDLNDGPGVLNAGPALQMFGQIDARVLAWRVAGESERRYPDHLPEPEVINGRFMDPAQAIEWSVPQGWSIVDYRQTWPSNLVAAAEHVNGARVELSWLSVNPWERAGTDWIESRLLNADNGMIEALPFGPDGAWLLEHKGQFRLIMPGPDGYWQLTSDRRDQIEELAGHLTVPAS